MQRWQYHTTFLTADTEVTPVPLDDDIVPANHPVHSPYSLIPQLNWYGEKGWELLSIQPVAKGKKEDVQLPVPTGQWGKTYFCTFKRPVE